MIDSFLLKIKSNKLFLTIEQIMKNISLNFDNENSSY